MSAFWCWAGSGAAWFKSFEMKKTKLPAAAGGEVDLLTPLLILQPIAVIDTKMLCKAERNCRVA